jgi:hypothetical protein
MRGCFLRNFRDLHIRQAEVRRARRRDLCAAVERIGDGAQHGQQIDGRAAIEEEARRREDVRDAIAVERVEVVVDLRQPAEENGEALQVERIVRIPLSLDPRRDRLRLGEEAVRFLVVLRVDDGDARVHFAPRSRARFERVICGTEYVRIVQRLLGEEPREHGVDGVEERRIAAELLAEDATLGAAACEVLRHAVVRLGIGAAEAIDRLLRIADHDGLARHERAAGIARELLDDEVELPACAGEHRVVAEDRQRAQQQIVEVDDAELALLRIEIAEEPPRHRQQRQRRAMRDQAVVDRVTLVAGAQHDHRLLERAAITEIDEPQARRDRREVLDPGVGRAARERRGADVFGHARGRGVLACGGVAADPEDRVFELQPHVGVEVAEVVRGLFEQVAPLEQRQDQLTDLEQVADMREQQFPLAHDLLGGIDARLRIDPRVVQLSV